MQNLKSSAGKQRFSKQMNLLMELNAWMKNNFFFVDFFLLKTKFYSTIILQILENDQYLKDDGFASTVETL